MDNDKTKEATTNADPITGAPGAHPVGVGLGAAAGGVAGGIAAGAAVGTVAAGPVGTVVGAAVGAIAGGLGGKAVAEHFDPTTEATEAASTEPDLRTTTLPQLEKAAGDMPASS
jgi:phage tail tape-measure protein